MHSIKKSVQIEPIFFSPSDVAVMVGLSKSLTGQKNSAVSSGSGSLPSV
jgi:hypothetical protein